MAATSEPTQNERLAVIEKQLDNVVTLLNVELRQLRENSDRDRDEFRSGMKTLKADVQARPTKTEIDLMRGESERRWGAQAKWNWTLVGIAATNVSGLVFFLLKLVIT